MKSILSISILLLTNHFSLAQVAAEEPVCPRNPAFYPYKTHADVVEPDSTFIPEINIRGCCRCDSVYFYIDGIKVRGTQALYDNIQEVTIITGGLPVHYGDVNSSIIRIVERKEE